MNSLEMEEIVWNDVNQRQDQIPEKQSIEIKSAAASSGKDEAKSRYRGIEVSIYSSID